MAGGALGRGSYQSAIAGTVAHRLPVYYPSAYELVQLHSSHREVVQNFLVRDKVFDNKFPASAVANGLFKMPPSRREMFHEKDVVESIRKRSIWMKRIAQQRAINAAILRRAEQEMSPQDMEARFSYRTPDADAYFNPSQYTAANNWPNYWQHPTERHVVPKPRWRRVPELDGITRVQDPLTLPAMDF